MSDDYDYFINKIDKSEGFGGKGKPKKKASSTKSAGNFLVFIIEYKVKTVGYQHKHADFS